MMKKFFNSRVINNLEDFKRDSDVIIVNRLDDNIKDVKEKIYTRDIFTKGLISLTAKMNRRKK